MKVSIRNQNSFNLEAIKLYQKHFDLTDEKTADIIIINDFKPILALNKIVACNSTGIEHIKAKKIISLRDEDLSSFTAVAELTLGMAIYCSRTFKREEIKDKVWAIIGMGRIGVQVSDLVARNGVINGSCLGFDRGSSFKSLKKCDIVSLHITADEENRGFMSQKMFEQMKDGAIFLNSAREWLVKEKALKWALNNKLAGCWTDFDLPFTHPKLITTPHLGGSTKESRAKTELIIAKKLVKLYGST